MLHQEHKGMLQGGLREQSNKGVIIPKSDLYFK